MLVMGFPGRLLAVLRAKLAVSIDNRHNMEGENLSYTNP